MGSDACPSTGRPAGAGVIADPYLPSVLHGSLPGWRVAGDLLHVMLARIVEARSLGFAG